MPKNEISYKSSLPLHQAMSLLENLVNSLKKGAVCFQVGAEYVFLNLDGALPMEVHMSASGKKGKSRITVELTWREAAQKDPDNPTMTISSQPPSTEDAITDKTAVGKINTATRAKGTAQKASASKMAQAKKTK